MSSVCYPHCGCWLVGICFIGKRDFGDFIQQYVDDVYGLFIDVESGSVLGEHKGLSRYTVGQRARIAGAKEPW